MPWNQPGGKDNGDDGWGKRPGNQGPPDLDEAFRRFVRKLFSISGGKSDFGKPKGGSGALGFTTILIAIAVIYVLSGIYIVKPAERAVVTQFGKYVATKDPGPHWIPRFIRAKRIVNTEKLYTSQHGGQMLTKDENIVQVEITVQYRISDPREFLFNVVDPVFSLKQATESALRTVVGHSSMDFILTSGRSEIASQMKQEIEDRVKQYNSGLLISVVTMQPAKAPEEVKEAFDDVIKAREDEVRLVNEAEAYARKITPIARGNAQRLLEEARAYKEQEVLKAKGQTAKFIALQPEYKSAPEVTRERMYLETVSDIMGNLQKVIVSPDSNNIMYIPLDKLINSGRFVQGADKIKGEMESIARDSDKKIASNSSSNSAKPQYRSREDFRRLLEERRS